MRLYYFTKAEHALSNIEKRRIKISRLDQLNDPFEWMAPYLPLKGDRLALRRTKQEMSKNSGLICFSKDWTDPVQWSHYADHHKGMCLGFDIDDQWPTEVTYQKERKKIESLAKFKAEGKMTEKWLKEDVICSKFENWHYEQEWRTFIQLDHSTVESGLYFLNFSKELILKEVIVGHNSAVKRKELDAVLGDLKPYVRAFKARLAFQKFSVCEQENPRYWR